MGIRDIAKNAGISIPGFNVGPTITGFSAAPAAWTETGGSAVRLDTDITLADTDSPDFSGGNVTVTKGAGVLSTDVLGLYTDDAVFSLSLSSGVYSVTHVASGLVIGTYSAVGTGSGLGGFNLAISLNANATPARVEQLVEHLTWHNTTQNAANAEANPTRVISVTVNDGDGGTSASQSLTLTVTDDNNDAPTAIALGTASIAENSTNGSVVGSLSATDDTASGSLTWTLTDDAGGRFAIGTGANAGKIVVADGSLLDYEATTAHNVIVKVDDGLNDYSQTLTISVTDANDAPVITSAAAVTVAENSTTVLTATATDQDANTPTWTITGGADQSLFSINATTGALAFKAAPSFETKADANNDGAYLVQVTANDGKGASTNQTVTVTVSDVNEAPTFTSTATATVAENTKATGYSAAATDVDAGDTQTYSLAAGGDSALFSIDAATGALSFVSAPDYEAPADAGANNVYNVTVQVTDSGKLTASQAVTITVTDVAAGLEVPSFSTITAATLAENVGAGTVMTVAAIDPTGAPVAYSFADGTLDNGTFTIDAATGAISNKAAIDYEAKITTWDLDVKATGANGSTTATASITLTDVNESAPTSSNTNVTIVEDGSYTFAVSDFDFADADGTAALSHIKIIGTVGAGVLKLDGTTVNNGDEIATADVTKLTFTPTANGNGDGYSSFTFQVKDGVNYSATQTVTIDVTAVNDAPTATGATLTATEDTVYTVTLADLGYSDVEGSALSTVRIDTAPTAGTLFFDTDGSGTFNTGDVVATAGTVFAKASFDANKILYAPDANANGAAAASFTYSVSDGTTYSAAPATATINVTAVDDAAANTVPGAQTVNEDTSLVLSTVSVSEVDGENVTVQVSATQGVLTLASTSGLTFATGDGTADGTIKFTGTVAAANAALAGLTYKGNSDYNGADTITISTDDAGASVADVDTIAVTVNAVDDAPVVATNKTLSVEDGGVNTTITSAYLASTDADTAAATLQYQVTTLPSWGILYVSGEPYAGGLITQAQIDAGALVYQSNDITGTSQADSFTFSVTDGSTTVSGQTFNFTVYQGNVAPSILNQDSTSPLTALTFAEGAAAAQLDSDVSVSDVNTSDFGGGYVQVAVTTNVAAGDTFSVKHTGTDAGQIGFSGSTVTYGGTTIGTVDATYNGVYNAGTNPTAVLRINLADGTTRTAVERLAEAITYSAPSSAADTGDSVAKTVTFTINDGEGVAKSGTNTLALTLNGTNDAPTVGNATVTATEDATYTFNAGTFTGVFTDIDAADSLQAIQFIADPAAGTLQYNGGAYTAGTSVALADIGKFTFNAAANANGTGYTTLQFKAFDGTAWSDGTGTITVDVTAVNDAPTAAGGTLTVTEDVAYTITLADLGYADIEGSELTKVRVDTLPGAGTLKLSGVAISAGDEVAVADLANLTFTAASNANGAAYTTFTYSVHDGSTYSTAPATATINVTAVDDAAATTVPGAQTVDEDTNLTFTGGNAITVSEVDGENVTVEVAAANGVLSLSGTTGLTFATGDGTTDATVKFTGSVADVNAALNGLVYKGNANYNGTDTITLTTDDAGASAADADTITVNVTAINDAPVATAQTVTATEDTQQVITLAGTDVDTGDQADLTYVVVTAPSSGTLWQLGNDGVTKGAQITGGQVVSNSSHQVLYIPAANANGNNLGDFTFSVIDPAAADSTGAVTVNVTSVNDAPVNTVPSAEFVTSEGTSFALTGISFADVDHTSATVTLSVASGTITVAGAGTPASATVSSVDVSGSTSASVTFTGTIANINTLLSTIAVDYAPAPGFGGSDTLTVTTSDGVTSDVDTVAITVQAMANEFSFDENAGTMTDDASNSVGTSIYNFGGTGIGAANFDTVIVSNASAGDATVAVTTSTDITFAGGSFSLLDFASALDGTRVVFADGSLLKSNTGGAAGMLAGGALGDQLIAGSNGDTLRGLAGNDKLVGGSGNDYLYGGTGDDIVAGGGGADRLIGGIGNDTLTGDAGADYFVYTAKAGSQADGIDTITDFVQGTDKIMLLDVGANGSQYNGDLFLLTTAQDLDGDTANDDTQVDLADGSSIWVLNNTLTATDIVGYLGT